MMASQVKLIFVAFRGARERNMMVEEKISISFGFRGTNMTSIQIALCNLLTAENNVIWKLQGAEKRYFVLNFTGAGAFLHGCPCLPLYLTDQSLLLFCNPLVMFWCY